MKKDIYRLSKSEDELMEMLWTLNTPMTYIEIIETPWERTWKDSYLLKMLRTLESDGLIHVCGVELQGKAYIRKFLPSLTKEEYIAKAAAAKIDDGKELPVLQAFAKETTKSMDSGELANVMANLVKKDEEEIDEELKKKLEDIIKEIREKP